MSKNNKIKIKDIKRLSDSELKEVDAIIGHAIGDAMGVPVEFKDRG